MERSLLVRFQMQWWTLKQLKSKSAKARRTALEKLGAEGDAALVKSITELLADPDEFVRAAAADALGRIRSEEAVPALTRVLVGDPEPAPRSAAAKAIQGIGSRKAIRELVDALGDPAGEVSWQAAQALKAISWEPGDDVEKAAWHLALSHFEVAVSLGASAVEPLTMLLRGTVSHRCVRAVEGLATIGGAPVVEPLLAALKHNDFTVRSAAATALAQIGDARAIDPLVEALQDAHHQVCLAVCHSLSKVGDERAVEPLITCLQHAADDVRAAAVEALGKLKDARAVEPLLPLLQDPQADVREATAVALGLIGEEKAIEHLVLALTDSQTPVRQAATGALSRIRPNWESSEGAHQAMPGLQVALKNNDYWVRQSATEILRKLGASDPHEGTTIRARSEGASENKNAAHAILISMLGDGDRAFRQAAAEALGRIGQAESIPFLVERLSDPDRGVHTAAARSLNALRWQANGVDSRARQYVALERWGDAAALGSEAVDAIAGTVIWNDELARQRAIEALVRIGDANAISALRNMAAHPIKEIREDAATALTGLEGSQSARAAGATA